MKLLRYAAVIVLLGCIVVAPRPALAALRGEIHVHSDVSTGDFSLDGLADLAEKQGVDVLMLSENYLVRIEYSLPPFRALTRVTYADRSVRAYGIERFLARVAATQRRFPRLVIIPGVEVIPHYYWTGSPFDLDMTLHDTQKNLLIFGLSDAAKLRGLPVIGNGAGQFTLASVIDVVPALLLIPGVRLLLVKRQQRIRIGRAWVIVRRRRWITGTLFCVIGTVAAVRAWPFGGDRYPYWQNPGLAPHQDLINHVHDLGGITVWSFPEARDTGERFVGPVHVSWRTDPYPDDLLRTSRYTAFGAVYEDTTSFEHAGRGWDTVLGQYARGERSQPAWAMAESGFHGFHAGKRIGHVQTVFLTNDRSEAGVLDTFKRGRMYALLRSGTAPLSLAEFTVTGGSTSAGTGETLRIPAGTLLEVRIGVDIGGGAAQPIRVNLVRNGSIVASWAADAPCRLVYREPFDGAPGYFRLGVGVVNTPGRLLSNPIFVKAS